MRVVMTMTVEADLEVIDDNMPEYVIEDLFNGKAKVIEWGLDFMEEEE